MMIETGPTMFQAVKNRPVRRRTKRTLFEAVVQLRRSGGKNEWVRTADCIDSKLKYLFPRVAYGGKKGWRAFCRLWAAGIRPGPPIANMLRLTIRLKGFEVFPDWA